MPKQRFEDYGLTGGIASEKADDQRKAQANAKTGQQPEDTKTTLDIEAEKQKQQQQQNQQRPKPKQKENTTTRRKK